MHFCEYIVRSWLAAEGWFEFRTFSDLRGVLGKTCVEVRQRRVIKNMYEEKLENWKWTNVDNYTSFVKIEIPNYFKILTSSFKSQVCFVNIISTEGEFKIWKIWTNFIDTAKHLQTLHEN